MGHEADDQSDHVQADDVLTGGWSPGDTVRDKVASLIRGDGPSPTALRMYARLVTPELVDEVDVIAETFEALADTTVAALKLTSRGWALSSQSNLVDIAAATAALAEGDSDRCDRLLTESWERNGGGRTVFRIETLGWWDIKLNALHRSRAHLVAHAWDRHLAGDYVSAPPVALAQIDGLTADVAAGKQFFSKNQQADVVDETVLTTLVEGLAAVRDVFSGNLYESTTGPTMSRHGVLHGRSTGYATRTYSAQCLALTAAVVDWAQHLDQALEPPTATMPR